MSYLIPVTISDLNYNGTERAVLYTVQQWERCKKWNGRYLIQRCGWSKYDELIREEQRERYSKAIQRKYNVGANWQQNRYFVEQVRPSLN